MKLLEPEIKNRIAEYITYLNNSDDIIDLQIMSDLEYSDFSLSGLKFKSNSYFYPIACGFDVGCGVSVFKTTIKRDILSYIGFRRSQNTPFGIKKTNYIANETSNLTLLQSRFSLGMFEIGNHFIEIRKKKGDENLYLIIHSGITEDVKLYFMRKYLLLYKKYLGALTDTCVNGYELKIPLHNEDALSLIKDFELAINYALVNRKYLAENIAKNLSGKITEIIDSPHDFITIDNDGVTFSHGVQKFTLYNNDLIAYVISGADTANYFVKTISNDQWINHGSSLQTIDYKGNRHYSDFAELLINQDFMNTIKPIYCLEPIIGCKRRGNHYEYNYY